MNILIYIYGLIYIITSCVAYNILTICPHNGHDILFTSLIEELAIKNHNVTVVSQFNVKKHPNIRHISLKNGYSESDKNIEEHLKYLDNNKIFGDFSKIYDASKAFTQVANRSCEGLILNKEVQKLVKTDKYDVVIVELFVSDCGFVIAHKVGAPVVGMTAHALMPHTFSRLGAPNNPAFVPNHLFGSGSKPHLLNRIKSAFINVAFNIYHKFIIQRNDQEIVKKVYPDTPHLESLSSNMSLLLLNQYFPLTGSRLHGANIIEIGGLHVKEHNDVNDQELKNFLDTAQHGVVYISFGRVAKNLPRKYIEEIIKVTKSSNKRFVWKIDNVDASEVPKNVLLRRWLQQPSVLCHDRVVAFVTHSGALSSNEAIHCGVPMVSVPLFGDQFANAKLAEENGLGVTLDIEGLYGKSLKNALETVFEERFQKRAKHLSKLWRDRPLSAMDTAVFWIEYVARHKGDINMRPPTVDLPLYQYLMLDIVFIFALLFYVLYSLLSKIWSMLTSLCKKKPQAPATTAKAKKKKNN